ncbi:MAG: radical SAM protein [Candidatus Omnitrophica bacterium]|nr:radical SAM protein [Candidatus Omnitrophota bacterium]
MKVVFVQAPATRIRYNVGGAFSILPLGIAYLARQLKNNNIDFEFFYPRRQGDFFSEFQKYMNGFSGQQILVGIYTTLFSAREAFCLAQVAKNSNKKNVTLLGGPVTSFSPDSIFRFSDWIDFIISGDAEDTLMPLIFSLPQSKFDSVSNISYRHNGRVISNNCKEIGDLDALGFAMREAFPMHLHKLYPPMGRYAPAYLVETMRGCGFSCGFCSLPKIARVRSVDIVINELNLLKKEFKAREGHFIDPTFTFRKERTMELCQRIVERKIDIAWSCKTRVDCLDEELIQQMKKAGCYMIHFGVESPNEHILSKINKGHSRDQICAAFLMCNKYKIKTGAFMIMGATRFENKKTVNEAISFIRKIKPTFVLYDQIRPIPGSALTVNAQRDGIITQNDIEQFYLGDKTQSKLHKITVTGITKTQVEQWVSRASRAFYLSGQLLWRMLCSLKTVNDWINAFRAGIFYFSDMTWGGNAKV